MVYPHKWSPISYKSSAGQRKHIGQRPMLYRWTRQPTSVLWRLVHMPLTDGLAVEWLGHCNPLPSNKHHRRNGDCLEGKWENYQVCSVQYCVQQLYTVNCTHIWTDLTVLWIVFCLTWPISLCLGAFLYILCITVYCMHFMCRILTWWGGHGWIEAYP